MIVKKAKGKIIISDDGQFNIKDIAECGQLFRYKEESGTYTIYSLNKKAVVKQNGRKIEIVTDDVDYFYNYFDLSTDYNKIKKDLIKKGVDKKAIEFGKGIRILRQDKYEMIISFIISANNNIKRIQSIINNICESAGTKKSGYYAFPTVKQLSGKKEKYYSNLGCGYRSTYLVDTVKKLEKFDYKEDLPTEELRKYLLSLKGVGPKVADCILLFAYSRFDSFPTDTWIEKIYHENYETGLKNPKDISKYLVKKFGNLSGYAQQYLFYYRRSN